jgi:F0F1-type ATP synthase assembly protein I
MSKVIVTIGILIGFFFLFGIIVYANKGSGTPGILGLILFMGLIAGLRAVWKKQTDKNEETDKHQLDKRD